MFRLFTLFFVVCFPLFSYSQSSFHFTPQNRTSEVLDEHFTAYSLYAGEPSEIADYLQQQGGSGTVQLNFGRRIQWTMSLQARELRMADFQLVIAKPGGREVYPRGATPTYQGELAGVAGSRVSMTVAEKFLFGFVKTEAGTLYFEPAHHLDESLPEGLYVVYQQSDVIPKDHVCGTDEEGHEHHNRRPGAESTRMMQCYGVPMGLAADHSLFNQYGSESATQNFMLGVLNNVQTNYDDEFEDEIEFQVQGFFISTCPSCDPWTSSNDAGVLLNSFANWGESGGFGFSYSLATLWTNRNLAGSTIGVAYLGGLCSFNKYNVCQRFSLNSEQLRVLQAHEIGHNFNAVHDASGNFIMAPSVNSSNQWSNTSVNDIDNFVDFRAGQPGCFSSCGGVTAQPPVAAIGAPVTEACTGSFLQFIDESENQPTSWQWTFQGGIPSSSTEQNPTVQYPNPGGYVVSLTVSNAAGTDITVLNQEIQISQTNNSTNYLFYETFENGLVNWQVINPDNGITWDTREVAGNPHGDRAAFMDNFNYSSGGQTDAIVSPPINLAQESNARLFIDYAYARYNSFNADRMRVLISTDGGNTFPDEIFVAEENGGGNFATAPDQTSEFTPSVPDDWCFGGGFGANCINIDLSDYFGESDVRVRIENISDFGNNLYLDKVWVTSDCIPVTPPVSDFSADVNGGCAVLEVNFFDLSVGEVDAYNWIFPGGAPNQSSQQFPTVLYSEPGLYPVTLQVTNVAGTDVKTREGFIFVEGEPNADFVFDVDEQEVSFTNLTDNYLELDWDFGDSNGSTEANPVHTYDDGGTYDVTLIAENDCGTDTLVQEVSIEASLQAAFSADNTQGCPGLEVSFSDTTSEPIASRLWSFEGGTPESSTAENPLVLYSAPGTYDVQLIVTDSSGLTDTLLREDFIVIDSLPEAAFTFQNETGSTVVHYTNTSLRADSLRWFFTPDSSSTEENPVYDYEQDGVYTTQLIAYGSCSNDTTSQEITIVTPPAADFGADWLSGCGPILMQFVNYSSANATDFSWVIEGGMPGTTNDQDPIVMFDTAGVYEIMLIASNSAGADTSTQLVEVDGMPDAAFEVQDTIGNPTIQTQNNSNYAFTFEWDFGDGNSSSAIQPAHTYEADGLYTIRLVAFNDCGSDTSFQSVTIVTPPVADFVLPADTGCVPFTIMPQDSSSDNVTAWQWSAPGATPDSSDVQSPTFTYDSVGTYTIVLEVSNAAGSSTASANVVIINEPEAEFVVNTTLGSPTVQLTNSSQGAVAYSWDFGDGNDSSAKQPTHTYAVDGTYTITLIADNACGSDTTSREVTITTAPTAAFSADATEGCVPFTIQLTDESSDNVESWDWQAAGSEEGSSDAQNPSFTYTSAGNYIIYLTVSNAAGSSTDSLIIQVNELPLADFVASDTLGSLWVTFENTAENADSLRWFFGDGGTSTAGQMSYQYAEDGTYEASLIAYNGCGTDTAAQTLNLQSAPQAGFSASPVVGCAPLQVSITNEASDNTTSWSYVAPGAAPPVASGPEPTFVYTSPGQYTITQQVSNGAGADTDTLQVTVLGEARAAFTAEVQTGDTELMLTNESTDATSYFWEFGDGNSSTDSLPQHTYAEDGIYDIILVATNSCGSDTATATVEVVTPPAAGFASSDTVGCAPLTISITDLASSNTDLWSWTVLGAEPEFSTETEPAFTFEEPGEYVLIQQVTNEAGTDSDSLLVTVLGGPTAGFDAFVEAGATELQLQDQSSDASSYFWDFGDGNSSNEAAPEHEYQEEGSYTVTQVVSNSCGSDTAMASVEVTFPPQAGFALDATTGCAPLSVQVTDESSSNINSWSWSAPGASPESSTAATPAFTYETPGQYTLYQEVSNAAGSSIDSAVVTVLGPPTAAFASNAAGYTVTFENNSVNADSFRWEIGSLDTLTTESPTYSFQSAGEYIIRLTAFGSCGSDTVVDTVVLLPKPPSAAFEAEVTEGCAPFEVDFVDNSTDASSYQWSFPGGIPESSTEVEPTVVYSTPGSYTVTLTVYNAVDSSIAVRTDYILVGEEPQAAFAYSVEAATATFSSESSGAAEFLWHFGDGQSSTDSSPTHVYDSAGTYTVLLVVSNACGQDSLEQVVEIIGQAPQPQVAMDRAEGCPPMTVNFSGSTLADTAYTWSWSFPGGTPASATEQNPSIVYDTPGTYAVELTATNAFGSNTVALQDTIVVLQPPAADFSYTAEGLEVAFSNLSSGSNTTYLWSFGDGSISTEESPAHEYAGNGTYTVTLAAANACDTVAVSQEVEVMINSTADERWVEGLQIYPNPSNGQFTVSLQARPAEHLHLQLFNAVGQLVARRTEGFETGRFEQQLQLNKLPAGLYLLELSTGQQSVYRRIVIE